MKSRNQRFVELVKVYASSALGHTLFNSKAEPQCVNAELVTKAVGYSLDVRGQSLSNFNTELYKQAVQFCKWIFSDFNEEYKPPYGESLLKKWRDNGQVSD